MYDMGHRAPLMVFSQLQHRPLPFRAQLDLPETKLTTMGLTKTQCHGATQGFQEFSPHTHNYILL